MIDQPLKEIQERIVSASEEQGKRLMANAVLRWAVDHKEQLGSLSPSLLNAIDEAL